MTVMRTCHDFSLISQIRTLLKYFDYATCGLYGREQSIVVLRESRTEQPNAEVIAQLDGLLGMVEGAPMLNYDDAKRSVSKRILAEDG
ncbi:MAG: assimilatory nitrate reductase catalytic subunit [Methylophilaceae bacterium]|jgi:assimilatory nitrate reductase catalytic subunit